MARRKTSDFILSALTIILIITAVVFLFIPFDGPFGEILAGIAAVVSLINDTRRGRRSR